MIDYGELKKNYGELFSQEITPEWLALRKEYWAYEEDELRLEGYKKKVISTHKSYYFGGDIATYLERLTRLGYDVSRNLGKIISYGDFKNHNEFNYVVSFWLEAVGIDEIRKVYGKVSIEDALARYILRYLEKLCYPFLDQNFVADMISVSYPHHYDGKSQFFYDFSFPGLGKIKLELNPDRVAMFVLSGIGRYLYDADSNEYIVYKDYLELLYSVLPFVNKDVVFSSEINFSKDVKIFGEQAKFVQSSFRGSFSRLLGYAENDSSIECADVELREGILQRVNELDLGDVYVRFLEAIHEHHAYNPEEALFKVLRANNIDFDAKDFNLCDDIMKEDIVYPALDKYAIWHDDMSETLTVEQHIKQATPLLLEAMKLNGWSLSDLWTENSWDTACLRLESLNGDKEEFEVLNLQDENYYPYELTTALNELSERLGGWMAENYEGDNGYEVFVFPPDVLKAIKIFVNPPNFLMGFEGYQA